MPALDSLSGLDNVDVDPHTKTLSIFQENYHYAKAVFGFTHTEAYHYAVDYHRKFTARESTDDWETYSVTLEDERFTTFDYVLFNQIVTRIRLDQRADVKDIQYFFLIVRLQQLEQYLSPENLRACVQACGQCYPDEVRDIAAKMGFKIRPNGSCNSMTRYRQRLQTLARDFVGDMFKLPQRLAEAE